MIKVGQIITLDNNEEYAVLEQKTLNDQDYYILMSTKRPVKVEVCTKDSDNEITIIDDKKIIKDILLKLKPIY